MAGISIFETNIFPVTSPRGMSVVGLTGLGLFCCLGVSTAREPREVDFPLFMALFTFFGAFCLHFNYQNFAVDRNRHRYRYFNNLFGFPIGTWQPLPIVSAIVMKYFSELPISGRRGWQVQNFQAYCIVMLSTTAANHKGIIVYKFPYRDKTQALQLTAELAQYFDVPTHIYDAPQPL
jgi:hypothetical protein